MGFRSNITSMIVSVLIMAITWELAESGVIRNLTGNFFGKIAVSLVIIIVAQILGSILSGGK